MILKLEGKELEAIRFATWQRRRDLQVQLAHTIDETYKKELAEEIETISRAYAALAVEVCV